MKPVVWIGILLLTGFSFLYNYRLTGSDTPQCHNIVMYPSYARINQFNTDYTRFASKYSLYLYREQGKDPRPNADNGYKLSGIPVLFIPGNAGSYRQVRSIASKMSNMIYNNEYKGTNPNIDSLDFFAADFNEDFTAFHGRIMLDQAEFLNEAIKYILSLYDGTTPPKSVIIVAHSMGGIVARVMVTLPNYVQGSITTMITLSSPHSKAPLTFDRDIMKIYRVTNEFWTLGSDSRLGDLNQDEIIEDPFSSLNVFKEFLSIEKKLHIAIEAYKRIKDIALISITGGLLDDVLPADYTSVNNIIPDTNGFGVFTSGIESVWTSIDHLAIVWCDQLRIVISNILLDIVDKTVPERVYPLAKRMEIFRKYLLTFQPPKLHNPITFDKSKFDHYQGTVAVLTPDLVDLIVCENLDQIQCFNITDQVSRVPGKYYGINLDYHDIYTKIKPEFIGSFKAINTSHIWIRKTIELSSDLLTTIELNVDNSLIAYNVKFNGENIKSRHYNKIETKWHHGDFNLNYHGTAPFIAHNDPLKLDVWNLEKSPVTVEISIDLLVSMKLLIIRYRTSIISYGLTIALLVFLFQIDGKTDTKQSFTKTLDTILTLKNIFIYIIGSIVVNLIINTYIGNKIVNSIYLENETLLGLGVTNFLILDLMFMSIGITCNYLIGMLIELILKYKPKTSIPLVPKRFKLFVSVVLMALTLLYLPYQVVYMICVFVEMFKVLRTRDPIHVTMFMIMIWILPINIPILIVLIHDLTINWKTSFSSHHNILSILPIFLMVNSNYKYRFNKAKWFVMYWIGYNWMYGSIDTFWIYHLFNYFCILMLVSLTT